MLRRLLLHAQILATTSLCEEAAIVPMHRDVTTAMAQAAILVLLVLARQFLVPTALVRHTTAIAAASIQAVRTAQ